MVYELRVYRCMPGRKADVLTRFRDHTMGFFRKHGINVVGFWETAVGELDELIYITRYESWEDRDKKWGAFQADHEWHRVREKSHERGWIVEHIRTALLTATDLSPNVQCGGAAHPPGRPVPAPQEAACAAVGGK